MRACRLRCTALRCATLRCAAGEGVGQKGREKRVDDGSAGVPNTRQIAYAGIKTWNKSMQILAWKHEYEYVYVRKVLQYRYLQAAQAACLARVASASARARARLCFCRPFGLGGE